jgi:cytochrome d ubiquinol oxidase subunit II
VIAEGVVFALASGWSIRARWFRLARIAAVAQVTLLLFGWGIAQYPYVLYPGHTVWGAAAPARTIDFVLLTLPIAVLLVIPSLLFLFRVFKSSKAQA